MKKGALLFLLVIVVLAAAVGSSQATGVHAQAQVTGAASALLSSAPAWTSSGEQDGGDYAYAVSINGDYNADGCSDLLVGAPKNNVGIDREGVVRVYYGSTGGLADLPDRTYAGGLKGSGFGNALAAAGDVNGDGYEDALIGAYSWQDAEADLFLPNEGAAFLYYGSASGLPASPAWSAVGGLRDAQFGYSVASAGDINGDGYADILIGARYYKQDYDNEGAAFLFLGSAEGLGAAPDWSTFGGQAVAGYGSAVSGAGDVNGDGYDDILVGAPGYLVEGQHTGAVFLFYGSENGPSLSPAWTQNFQSPDARFGAALSGVGDLNRDGYADLIVGAPGYGTATDLSMGAIFVYYGSPDGPSNVADIQVIGDQPVAYLGNSVASAGDINEDGFGDLVYAAKGVTFDQPSEGIVHVALGSNYPQLPVVWSATGDKADAYFGFSVSSAGDVNGDGLVDLAVGAPDYKVNQTVIGRAFLFLGQGGDVFPNRVYLPLLNR